MSLIDDWSFGRPMRYDEPPPRWRHAQFWVDGFLSYFLLLTADAFLLDGDGFPAAGEFLATTAICMIAWFVIGWLIVELTSG